MLNEFDHEVISMEDIRQGSGREEIASADVVIAFDPHTESEEVLHGLADWEAAQRSEEPAELAVVRVELDTEDDLEEVAELLNDLRTDESEGARLEEGVVDDEDELS